MAKTANIPSTPALLGSTIDNYIREVATPVLDRHPVTGMLKAKGRMVFNESGDVITWPVEMRRGTPTDHLPEEAIVSGRRAYHKTATLPYRKFYMSERIDKFTKLANRGNAALAKIWQTALKSMSTAMSVKLGQDFLNVDGNATASLKKVHGIPSFMGHDSAAHLSGAAYGPSDTYAGLSTAPANYGGTATNFPEHSSTYPCTPEACFWSPILIASDYAGWAATTDEWNNTWREALEYTALWMMERQGIKADTTITTPTWFQDIRNTLAAAEQVQITRSDTSMAVKLGYDTVSLNGTDIVHSQDMPSTTCYNIYWDAVSLHSMQGQLFEIEKDKDYQVQSDILTVDFLGNFRFESPAYFSQIFNIVD